MVDNKYTRFTRARVNQLMNNQNISEHLMSLDLDKSGSYMGGIVRGTYNPSFLALFEIISYLGVTPSEFFAPLDDDGSLCYRVVDRVRGLCEEDLRKVDLFLDWIR